MDQFQKIVSEAYQLPDGVNPYAWLSTAVQDMVRLDMPRPFYIHCWTNLGLFAMCFLVSLIALIGRYLQGALWLVKRQETARGRLVLPNSIVLFSFFSWLFCAIGIAYITLLGLGKGVLATYVLQAVLWPSLIFAVWSEAWAMAVAVWVSEPQRRGIAWLSRAKAWHVNAFFLGFFPLVFVMSLPVWILAAVQSGIALRALNSVLRSLNAAADAWDGASSFQVQQVWVDNAAKFLKHGERSLELLGRGGLVFMICIIIATSVFLPSGIFYMLMLKQKVKESVRSSQSAGLRGYEYSSRSQLVYANYLQRSYKLMILEVVTVTLGGMAYAVIAGWPAFFWQSLFRSSVALMAEQAVSLYIFSFFGTPVNFLICIRSIRGAMRSKAEAAVPLSSGSIPSSRSRTTQIYVTREKVVSSEMAQVQYPRKESLGGHTLVGSPSMSLDKEKFDDIALNKESSFMMLEEDDRSKV